MPLIFGTRRERVLPFWGFWLNKPLFSCCQAGKAWVPMAPVPHQDTQDTCSSRLLLLTAAR